MYQMAYLLRKRIYYMHGVVIVGGFHPKHLCDIRRSGCSRLVLESSQISLDVVAIDFDLHLGRESNVHFGVWMDWF